MKILLASGHKPGERLSKETGYREGDLNVELTKSLYDILKKYAEVDVYPYARDMYKDILNGCCKVDLDDYDYIFEVHFNAGGGVGFSVQLHTNYKGGISVELEIVKNMGAIGFRLRDGDGIVRRKDLLNMNTCLRKGIDYALVETCFYDSNSDMSLYSRNKAAVAKAIANGIIDGFGLKAGSGSNLMTGTVVNCSNLNVRTIPNGKTKDTIVGVIKAGSTVYIIGEAADEDGDTWYKVQAGAYVGYVWPKYVKL